jgi:hypothetical protein
MNPRNKVWLALFTFVLVAVTIACSCSSLTSGLGGGGTSAEPMTGLAGKWRDNAENTVHTIQWTGTTYHVASSVNDSSGAYTVASENWNGSTFTWVYEVPGNGVQVTLTATSVSGNNMNLTWSSTNGNAGTDVFTREP